MQDAVRKLNRCVVEVKMKFQFGDGNGFGQRVLEELGKEVINRGSASIQSIYTSQRID